MGTWSGASDAEVINAVLHGDIERYAELVDRYQRAAWKLAYSLVGNLEDAKDLSQNGFVKAYRSLRRFRRRAKFSTWLYRIIVNECKDFFKRKTRQPVGISLDGSAASDEDDPPHFEVADPSGDPSRMLANQELAATLGRAIAGLPMKQRMAFLLHHVHGLPLEEVGRVMGCRVGTVKAHLFRATDHLRRSLGSIAGVSEEVRV